MYVCVYLGVVPALCDVMHQMTDWHSKQDIDGRSERRKLTNGGSMRTPEPCQPHPHLFLSTTPATKPPLSRNNSN